MTLLRSAVTVIVGLVALAGATPGGVQTLTSGRIEPVFDEGLASAQVKLEVYNGVGVIAAHLCCGRAGTNGTVVVPLLRVGGGVNVDGVLVSGILTNDSIGGPQTRTTWRPWRSPPAPG